jgi:hypothetical protein
MDLQPQARKLNKFRKLCGTGIFYFFPKLLISIFRYLIAYLVPMPLQSTLVRRARGPEYQEFLDISS